MAGYIKGQPRDQIVLYGTCLDDIIEYDNPVRVIDAFVDHLDLEEKGIKKATPSNEGRPGYDPKVMLKIWLYGYDNKIRSSRKLARECKRNIELIWLTENLKPDHRTISDFRKDNTGVLKEIFFEFNMVCKEIGILDIKEVSQDGTKIRAVNSKEKNLTLNKIDDRIKRIEEKIEKYLKEGIELDEQEKVEEEATADIKELEERLEIYKGYKEEMESEGKTQKSLTDPESKLMKDNGSFNVCYNMQSAVTTDNHMVANFEITDKPADFGSMDSIVKETEEKMEGKIERNITDNGYSDRKDMMKLLENGTVPEVTPAKGQKDFKLETEYEEAEVSEEEINSTEKEDIKKVLRAGKIPKIYEDKIEKIEIKEETIRVYEDIEEKEKLTEEEMRDKAIKEGIFIRDIETNKVYCPGGSTLRQKSKNEDGIKYCNKLGCKNCKNPCTESKYKEVRFKEGQKEVIPKNVERKKKKKKLIRKEKRKKVEITLKIDKEALGRRMRTSEHHHGTLKRSDDAGYLLLKGKEKATGEMALYFCAYNMRRAINLVGVEGLLEYFENKKEEKVEKDFTKNIKNAIIIMKKILRMELI